MADHSQFKDEWYKRAEQVMNGIVTDEYFAIWLNRRGDNEEYGKFARELADAYFSSSGKK